MDHMNEQEFEALLLDIFDDLSDDDTFRDELENNRAESFEDAGVLTMNKGVSVTLWNGQKFYLTVQQAQ